MGFWEEVLPLVECFLCSCTDRDFCCQGAVLVCMHGILGGGVAPRGIFVCVAARIMTFVVTERCQPPTIARKMICDSPCSERSVLNHHPPGNVCYCFAPGPWVCGDAQTFHRRLWPRPVLVQVCVHAQTFDTSQHIKLSKSINFKRGHDLLLFFRRMA